MAIETGGFHLDFEKIVPCPHCGFEIPFESKEIKGKFGWASDEEGSTSWVDVSGTCPQCKKKIEQNRIGVGPPSGRY